LSFTIRFLFVCVSAKVSLRWASSPRWLRFTPGLLHPHNIDLRDRRHLLASCREVNANCLPPLLRRHPVFEIANWSSGHSQPVSATGASQQLRPAYIISFTEVSNHSLSQQCACHACHCASVSANALLPSRLKKKAAASPTTRSYPSVSADTLLPSRLKRKAAVSPTSPQFSPLKLTCANRLLPLRKPWTSLNLPRHRPLCYRASQRSSSAHHRSHCCTVTEVPLLQRCQNTPLVHSEGWQNPHPLPAT